jgi:uncharacterized cofD-like protein
MIKNPRIVLLGGGTGSFALLQGLKTLTSNLTAIVSMSDDGGSTGTLRDELGVLPPGDVRQCLVALSDLPEVRDLFSYRFAQGTLRGQSLGNMILSGLELQYGSFEDAIRVAGELLHVRGTVIPVTLQQHTLVVEDESNIYRGEHVVDGAVSLTSEATLRLDPLAPLNPAARSAILDADLVVIAPGSVYTSLLPLLIVSGMSAALSEAKAPIISVANLINKPLQTDNWHVVDYIKQLERHLGDKTIDMVLYNNQPIALALLKKYAADGELPVDIAPSRFAEVNARAIGARLVSTDIVSQGPVDVDIRRSFIRHDGVAVAEELGKVLA